MWITILKFWIHFWNLGMTAHTHTKSLLVRYRRDIMLSILILHRLHHLSPLFLLCPHPFLLPLHPTPLLPPFLSSLLAVFLLPFSVLSVSLWWIIYQSLYVINHYLFKDMIRERYRGRRKGTDLSAWRTRRR